MTKVSIIFFSGLFLLALFVSPVLATTIISPVLELSADPGTIQPGVVKVYNETNATLPLISSVEEFTAGDEDGQVAYLPPENRQDFLEWFAVSETSLILQPGQAAVVPFTVTIPATATPGGYYATIFWENLPTQQPASGNVGVRGKVGTLVFLRVNGEVLEQGEILDFSIRDAQSIHYQLPIIFKTRFSNTGNVHLQPQGTVTLKNFFGFKTVLPLGDGKANVLPKSIRQFEVAWGPSSQSQNFFSQAWNVLVAELSSLAVGKMTATLDLSFGLNQDQAVTQQISFWVVPYHLISVLVLGAIILLLGVKTNARINKLKRQRRNII